jgi:nucleoside-triphosphatase THEP1
MIDMLDALREKTMKNLATEDDQLLIDVIGSLKLSFMELSRAADQALREKAKATKR